MFLHNFFTISSQLMIIRSCTIMSAKPFKKTGTLISLKFFQRPYQLILERLGNFLKMFVKLPPWGTPEELFRVGGGHDH